MDRLRLAIVQALAAQPDPATTAALATCLGGKSADIGTEAVRSLHGIRIKESIPALIRGLDSSHAAVKERAQIALADLTGEAFPDAVAWRAWWSQQPLDYKPKAPTTVAADDVSTPAPAGPGTRFYGISTRSKHLVFILDRSGSMEGQDAQGGRKMDVAKKELIEAIRTLPDDATFNIIFYNSDYDLWQKKMTTATPANRKKAIAWVEKVEHVGATNIFDALERAFQLAGRGTHDKAYGLLLDTVFLLSDGLPNRGRLIAVNDILRSVADLNALKQVKIHAIGIGRDHDARLMRGLAELTGGSYIAR
jgi:hypothetical protein